jgi:hypothetical protein
MVRVQLTSPEGLDSFATIDGGLHYIVDGHNARLALTYQHVGAVESDGVTLADSNDVITLGGQLQL